MIDGFPPSSRVVRRAYDAGDWKTGKPPDEVQSALARQKGMNCTEREIREVKNLTACHRITGLAENVAGRTSNTVA